MQTGCGKSSDDIATRAKNPYLVTFDEWRSCFVYAPGNEWSYASAGAQAASARKRLLARLRKVEAWSGQVYVLGHSQGLEHLCVGGFAATKTVPDHHLGLVTGKEFGELLRAVLPLDRVPVVDVVLLAPWLGNHAHPGTAKFLGDALRALGAPAVRAVLHATPYETWPSVWDDVRVNGARIDRPALGSVHEDPLATVRRAALEHAAKGTIGLRRITAELERDLTRVVERQALHKVGASVRTLDDVALVTHLGQRGFEAFETSRSFSSFFLGPSGELAVDRGFAAYADHRKQAVASAAQTAAVTKGSADREGSEKREGSEGSEGGEASHRSTSEVASLGRGSGPEEKVPAEEPRPANTLARPPKREGGARKKDATGAAPPARATERTSVKEPPSAPLAQEAGFEKVDPWDWSSVRRKRPPVSPGNHALQTVEGFNEVPQRPTSDDRQQAREVAVEGPFMQKHAWQRERSFWESKVVEVDGAHAAPSPRRFNQFMRDHDETDPGHFTLPIRDWDLEPVRAKPGHPKTPKDFDDPRPLPPRPAAPAWVPGSFAIDVVGDVAARIEDEASRSVRGRVCKGVDESVVVASIAKLALEAERILREAAAAKPGKAPGARVDLRLTAFDAESIRRAVNAQVSGMANEGVAERTLVACLSSFALSLGAELKGVSLMADVAGTRPAAVTAPEASASSDPAADAGLVELSSAFFSYTSKDAWSNEAPDESVRANALLDHPSFKRAFRTGANDYHKVATHVANALSKEKQRLEIRVYHHPDRREVGEQRARALKKLWEHEQKLKGGGQEEVFSKKAWLKTVAITIRYIPRTDPKQTNVITFAVGGRAAPKSKTSTKSATSVIPISWGGSSVHIDARWACCTTTHDLPVAPNEPPARPLPEDPGRPDPDEPDAPPPKTDERGIPDSETPTDDTHEPTEMPSDPPRLPLDDAPNDPPVLSPALPPIAPPSDSPFVAPPVVPRTPSIAVVPPLEDGWVPGSFALAMSGDLASTIADASMRAVAGRVCKGVSEAAVAGAAAKLVTTTERILRDAAALKVGAAPSARVELKLTAFDAAAILRAVTAATAGLGTEARVEEALAAELAAVAASLHAEPKGLTFEAAVEGVRASATPPGPAEGGNTDAGLEELSSAFFSYTSKDAWANEAPDESVRANALLDDPSFKRVFRTGANDYRRVATHVANALSKERQRLEIRVYHHPERRAVGEQRARALKKLWEHEQRLKGGGQEEVFSKKAWLKTVAITIRYIPRTDPKQTNVITFAVGSHAAATRTKAVVAAAPVEWGASSASLEVRWACCTTAPHAPGKPEPERRDPRVATPTQIVASDPRDATIAKPVQPIRPDVPPVLPPVDAPDDDDQAERELWVPGSLALVVSGDVAMAIDAASRRAVEGRLCRGVSEASVAAAATRLVMTTEHLLRDAAAAKVGAEPSARVKVELGAFDAAAVRRVVTAATAGLVNAVQLESALTADLEGLLAAVGARAKRLRFEGSVVGVRSMPAPGDPPSDHADDDENARGLTELSSAFFSYTSKDSWSNDAPDDAVKANKLLDDETFRRVFRTGPNDYFRVASHVANALSKEKQRLEIRVYHHPDRREVGEQRARALKKLWEHEQKLKGGGQEEVFSKKAWLKTVAITIRYIPRTDPKQTNVITFAVGSRSSASSARPKTAAPSAPITWGASSAELELSWVCCGSSPEEHSGDGTKPRTTPQPSKDANAGAVAPMRSQVRGIPVVRSTPRRG